MESQKLDGFLDAGEGCPVDRTYCFGVRLHVVLGNDGEPVQTPTWFARQLAETNHHFAGIDVGFELVGVSPLPWRFETVITRTERDRLGRRRYTRRMLHVFLIGHLNNVDAPGEIRGVHWRDRAVRRRHWVVLAGVAPQWVLAHEIGHFFGLRHSKYPKSIMNKTERSEPPWEERSFAEPELRKMRRRLKRFVRTRELVSSRKRTK